LAAIFFCKKEELFPFDVFTHCFSLPAAKAGFAKRRTKKRTKWFELIFSNRNFEKFLFEKISSNRKKNFQVRLLCEAQNSE
jgi:hypothetical protein